MSEMNIKELAARDKGVEMEIDEKTGELMTKVGTLMRVEAVKYPDGVSGIRVCASHTLVEPGSEVMRASFTCQMRKMLDELDAIGKAKKGGEA